MTIDAICGGHTRSRPIYLPRKNRAQKKNTKAARPYYRTRAGCIGLAGHGLFDGDEGVIDVSARVG
jgi:hypothetical protein